MSRLHVLFGAATALPILVTCMATAAADTACAKKAADDYSAGIRLCDQDKRSTLTITQCKSDAQKRRDESIRACNTVARKAGGVQQEFLTVEPPTAPPSPPAPPPPTPPRQ